MPIVDMPLNELYQYKGRNPKPADFDAYWERALAELRGVDPQVQLVPSDFQTPHAECMDLYYTGVRGQGFTPNISVRRGWRDLIQ